MRLAVAEGLLVKGGGHGMAAGVTLLHDRLDDFRAFLERHFVGDVARLRADAGLAVDATLSAGTITPELIDALAAAGPFGAGSPEPVVALPLHRVVEHGIMGDGHCRVTLAARDGCRIRAVAFRSAGTPLADGLAAARGQLVHVAGTLTLNRWGGGQPAGNCVSSMPRSSPISRPDPRQGQGLGWCRARPPSGARRAARFRPSDRSPP